jgi:hypothetical protein
MALKGQSKIPHGGRLPPRIVIDEKAHQDRGVFTWPLSKKSVCVSQNPRHTQAVFLLKEKIAAE